jgi:hypothetical protein
MKIPATRIDEVLIVEVGESRSVAGKAPAAPPPPPDEPILISEAKPAPAAAAELAAAPAPAAAPEPAAKKLSKTGSAVPLIGFLGLLFTGASFGVRLLRRF